MSTQPVTTQTTTSTTTPLDTVTTVFNTEAQSGERSNTRSYIEIVPSGSNAGAYSAADLGMPTSKITIEAEIMPLRFNNFDTSSSGSYNFGGVVSFAEASVGGPPGSTLGNGWFLASEPTAGFFQFGISIGGGGTMAVIRQSSYADEHPPISPYSWTHLVATFDGNEAVFYINGKLVDALPVGGNQSIGKEFEM